MECPEYPLSGNPRPYLNSAGGNPDGLAEDPLPRLSRRGSLRCLYAL